jgi:dipeptidase
MLSSKHCYQEEIAMPCTTVLVGKLASNDGSTMIARTDDGAFDVKHVIVVDPKTAKKKYKSVLSHVEVDLPDNPLRFTACPNVDPKEGIWGTTGVNAANVGMTATETITSNPRVLAADPMVELRKSTKRGEKEIPGGIGEEDILMLVLPYIRSAREGVLRLASLLERYGTYESNGIAFNDENEVWWMETIGGHHWIARRVPDDGCVIAPNQFGLDSFDLEDAFGAQRDHLCSADLRSFIEDNRLDCNRNGVFNPRNIFGSHTDSDHIYNTPRAWFMGRYLTPRTHRWDGENAEFTPESDDIPWCLVPERKVAVEDVKYLLSAHYQGTPFNPYSSQDTGKRGMYRSIGINRTGVTALCQIRGDRPEPIKAVEWVCFGSTTFGAMVPVYPDVAKLPKYLSAVTTDVSTENFYWASRIIAALADHNYATSIQQIERYHSAVFTQGRRLIREYDEKMMRSGDFSLKDKANDALCAMAKEQATATLNKVLQDASVHMKNGYNRADN